MFQDKLCNTDDPLTREMTNWVCWIQEYNLDSISEVSEITKTLNANSEKLKQIGVDIPPLEVNETIHKLMHWENQLRDLFKRSTQQNIKIFETLLKSPQYFETNKENFSGNVKIHEDEDSRAPKK